MELNGNMHEVRIHGRGGQGAVLASKILAKALVGEGRHVLAIPSFGFERRGAPVVCFLRFADRPIRAATNIYHPDCVICIDPTVPRAVDIFAGIRDNATVVQATAKPAERLDIPDRVAVLGVCDAMAIAMEIFARPITNTIMLGAFARTTGTVSRESVLAGLETADFRDAGLEQNRLAVERGYAETIVRRLS